MAEILLPRWLRRPTVWTDGEEVVPAAVAFVGVEDVPPPVPLPAVPPPPRAPAAPDDEVLSVPPGFPPESEEAWVAQTEAVPWCPRPVSDDEVLARLGLEQEEPWVAQTAAVAWCPRPSLDDEVSAGLKNFPLEQEEYWTAAVVTVVPWLARPTTDDEARFTTAGAVVTEYEAPAPARAVSIWLPVAFAEEEAGAGLKNFGRDEDVWTSVILGWPPRPVTPSAEAWKPVVPADEEVSTTRATVEDESPWPGLAVTWAAVTWPSWLTPVEEPGVISVQDDDPPFVAQAQAAPWLARAVLGDEVLIHAGGPAAYYFRTYVLARRG